MDTQNDGLEKVGSLSNSVIFGIYVKFLVCNSGFSKAPKLTTQLPESMPLRKIIDSNMPAGWGYVIVPSRVWILFKGFSMQRWLGCSYQLIPGHPLSG